MQNSNAFDRKDEKEIVP